MAVSYLTHHFPSNFLGIDIPFVSGLDKKKTAALCRMMERNVNSPMTSSCGRLFDAIAALIGVRQEVNYEAQAAIELETSIAEGSEIVGYPFTFFYKDGIWVVGTYPLFEAVIDDLEAGVPSQSISQRFHNGLIEVFSESAVRAREAKRLNRVCLSGGSFNNVYLSSGLEEQLTHLGFEVFTHREVPCGDGGLSLGQAMIAAHQVL